MTGNINVELGSSDFSSFTAASSRSGALSVDRVRMPRERRARVSVPFSARSRSSRSCRALATDARWVSRAAIFWERDLRGALVGSRVRPRVQASFASGSLSRERQAVPER